LIYLNDAGDECDCEECQAPVIDLSKVPSPEWEQEALAAARRLPHGGIFLTGLDYPQRLFLGSVEESKCPSNP
jgi:hypothetical protein